VGPLLAEAAEWVIEVRLPSASYLYVALSPAASVTEASRPAAS
jgi:hypothetical protein